MMLRAPVFVTFGFPNRFGSVINGTEQKPRRRAGLIRFDNIPWFFFLGLRAI
jgi:hypothetical protein